VPSETLIRNATAARVEQDRDLIAALGHGDRDGAEELLATYGDRAYRLAIRVTGNAEDAEEVVQDAFVSVIRKIDTFRRESAFGSWLYRIVANAAYQKLRSKRGRDHLSFDEAMPAFDEQGRHVSPSEDWSQRAADPSRRAVVRTALTSALDELPPEARTLLMLHDVEGLSNGEVAEAMNLSISAVKSRVHRARLFVRKRVGDSII
jgi:RNA polymerase sigma-70 factor (ECF subfamily)